MSFTPIFSFGSAGGDSMDYDQVVPIVPVTGDVASDPSSERLAVRCDRVFRALTQFCLQGAVQGRHCLVVRVSRLNGRYVHHLSSCTQSSNQDIMVV